MSTSENPPKIPKSAESILGDINAYTIMFPNFIIQGDLNLKVGRSFLSFLDCIFEDTLVFQSGDFGFVSFQSCVFNKGVFFSSGEFENVSFDNCRLEELNINGGIFKGNFYVTGGQILGLRTAGISEFRGDFGLRGQTNATLALEPTLGVVDLLYRGFKNIVIEDFPITHLRLTGMIKEDANLLVQNCSMSVFHIKNLVNKGTITLKNSYPKEKQKKSSSLIFEDSDLGKLTIQNAELKNFDSITIRTCDMDNVTTNNVSWPRKISGKKMSKQQLIVAYRHLKMLAKREGDKPNELKFSAREKKVLIVTLPWHKVWDRIALLINWFTNNFNQSWTLPIVLLLLINYLVYCQTLNVNLFEGWTKIGDFFIFLNPVHKPDFVNDICGLNLSKLWQMWDFVGRIVSSYFYVQIVAGFRKYSKT